MKIAIKRIYEPYSEEDGIRILVDRIWPRGISREKASWQEWDKNIAPSTALRQWFGHDPSKWDEFKKRYRDELKLLQPEISHLLDLEQTRNITLLYTAKDPLRNQAIVLQEYLAELSNNLHSHGTPIEKHPH